MTNQTRYEELLRAVFDEENLQVQLGNVMQPDDLAEFRFYAAENRALNAAELAQAEQLRIANLISIATSDGPPGLMTKERRMWALEEAMKALGVPA